MNTETSKKKPTFDLIYEGQLFRELEEYPNYFISETGKIFHLKLRKILAVHPLKNGSLIAKLNREGQKPKTEYVHRLVAKTWIPNPNNYDVVFKINKDSNDCSVKNLKWGTQDELVEKMKRARAEKMYLYRNVAYPDIKDIQDVHEVTQRTVYNWKDRGEAKLIEA